MVTVFLFLWHDYSLVLSVLIIKNKNIMSKSKSMTRAAASRIQISTVKTSGSGGVTKGSFAARAQSAAAKSSKK